MCSASSLSAMQRVDRTQPDRAQIAAFVRLSQGRERAAYKNGPSPEWWPASVTFGPPAKLNSSDTRCVIAAAVRHAGGEDIENELGAVNAGTRVGDNDGCGGDEGPTESEEDGSRGRQRRSPSRSVAEGAQDAESGERFSEGETKTGPARFEVEQSAGVLASFSSGGGPCPTGEICAGKSDKREEERVPHVASIRPGIDSDLISSRAGDFPVSENYGIPLSPQESFEGKEKPLEAELPPKILAAAELPEDGVLAEIMEEAERITEDNNRKIRTESVQQNANLNPLLNQSTGDLTNSATKITMCVPKEIQNLSAQVYINVAPRSTERSGCRSGLFEDDIVRSSEDLFEILKRPASGTPEAVSEDADEAKSPALSGKWDSSMHGERADREITTARKKRRALSGTPGSSSYSKWNKEVSAEFEEALHPGSDSMGARDVATKQQLNLSGIADTQSSERNSTPNKEVFAAQQQTHASRLPVYNRRRQAVTGASLGQSAVGRMATTQETARFTRQGGKIKANPARRAREGDVVFHANMNGSPIEFAHGRSLPGNVSTSKTYDEDDSEVSIKAAIATHRKEMDRLRECLLAARRRLPQSSVRKMR